MVHRDIKPENIMLQDGHAMVADFGIGKAVSDVAGDTLTQAGMSVGTPAYMSPEQAAGDEVDGRSDLYSLGCVLYEMLVGEQPFTGSDRAGGDREAVRADAGGRDGPARGSAARRRTRGARRSPASQSIATAPARTSSTALGEMDAVRAATPAAPEKSLAVLPFANMSADPENEFFADGITEEILNALAHSADLRVAGRTSSFSFKGKHGDAAPKWARSCTCATVLEGSVRKSGNRLRITAQLVNAADGYHLWSERYDREIEDVFAVQDEIAAAIADRLRLTLSRDRAGAGRPRTKSMAAYELYLKGRALLYRRGPSIKSAIECFEQAVALDADYAQAWAGLADGLTVSAHGGVAPAKELMPRALAAARRAVALDDDLAEANNAGLRDKAVRARRRAGAKSRTGAGARAEPELSAGTRMVRAVVPAMGDGPRAGGARYPRAAPRAGHAVELRAPNARLLVPERQRQFGSGGTRPARDGTRRAVLRRAVGPWRGTVPEPEL